MPETISAGQRNDTVFRFASSLQGQGFTDEDIEEHVFKANRERVDPPLPDREVKTIIKSALKNPKGEKKNVNIITDLANAYRFIDSFKGQVVFNSDNKQWLVWNGKFWEPDIENKIMKFAMQTVETLLNEVTNEKEYAQALKHQGKERIKSIPQLASSLMSIRQKQLDAHNTEINLENGTLDLHTFEIKPHNPERFHTKLANVSFKPDADCPIFKSFLSDVFQNDNDIISYVQRVMGYVLTGLNDEQCLILLHGNGRNGKSVLLNLMDHILGDYSMTANAETFVKNNLSIRSDIARLAGARLVTASEVEHNKTLDEALIKNITGGENVTARPLYKNEFEYLPTYKIIIATNNLPSIHGIDFGIWRRLRIIPFKFIVPDDKVDKKLKEKLIREKNGILNFALEGLSSYLKIGLAEPQSIKNEVIEYRRSSDIVQQFLDDCYCEEPKGIVTSNDLYNNFCKWCSDSGHEPYSKTRFGSIMTRKEYKKNRIRHDRKKQICYFGLKSRDEGYEQTSIGF